MNEKIVSDAAAYVGCTKNIRDATQITDAFAHVFQKNDANFDLDYFFDKINIARMHNNYPIIAFN